MIVVARAAENATAEKTEGRLFFVVFPFAIRSLINIRILDEYLHSDEFSLGRARTLENTERFGMLSKAWNRLEKYERHNDAIIRLGYACKYFPFVVSVEKKKEKQIFLLRACRRIVNAKKHLSYLPSGISFHRGDPFQKVHSRPRSASSRCQRRIIGTLAGSRRREKRRWLA